MGYLVCVYGLISIKGTNTTASAPTTTYSFLSCPSGEKDEAQRNFAIFIYNTLPMIFVSLWLSQSWLLQAIQRFWCWCYLEKREVEGSNSQATRPQRAHIQKQLTFFLSSCIACKIVCLWSSPCQFAFFYHSERKLKDRRVN